MATTECPRTRPSEREDLTLEDQAVARWYSEQLREDPLRFLRGEEQEDT